MLLFLLACRPGDLRASDPGHVLATELLGAGDTAPTDAAPTDTAPTDTAPPEVVEEPPVDTAVEDTEEPADTAPPDPCAGGSGSLAAGEDWTVDIDDFTGDEATTEPKSDANDGRDGDEPTFQRTNVARAHCGGTSCYWYSSSHQESGEPSPSGTQYVDYRPDFAALGQGWYSITARYRQTENRAEYPAEYAVTHADGTALVEVDQREGSDDESFSLGRYRMCAGSFVRVEDSGSESITFNAMTFTFSG